MLEFERFFETPDDGANYFAGYYDKSPISACGHYLFGLRTNFLDHIPGPEDSADIVVFDLQSGDKSPTKIGTTHCFNWQQGCQLQWVGPDFNSKVIYNDCRDGKYVSVLYDFVNETETVFPEAIYAMCPSGKYGYCIDYERHYWCRRGYSYSNIANKNKDQLIVPKDGISVIDFETNKVRKILTVEQLNKVKPLQSMFQGPNYVEHIMPSPDGKMLSFLHRWKFPGGIYARLFVCNNDGSDMRLINDSGRMSHFCWLNNTQILGWGGVANSINSLRKSKFINNWLIKPLMPIYRAIAKGDSVTGNSKLSRKVSGDSYLLFDIEKKTTVRIAADTLNKDGHPSANPVNRKLVVTDSYPDLDFISQLILYDTENDEVGIIDELASTPELANSPLRSDLHPKWSYCGNMICVDTLDRGKRDIFAYRKKS